MAADVVAGVAAGAGGGLSYLLTVDPGVNACGWAVWINGTLDEVGYGDPPAGDSLVIEVPQIYRGVKSRGDPNDLIWVAFEAGRVAGRCRDVEAVLPRRWKGTIRKEVMVRRILSKLTDAELQKLKGLGLPPSKEHNVCDAVGIGLWKLGRL